MPLSSSMPTVKTLAIVVSSCLLAVLSKAATGWFLSYHSCTGACFQEELTSCLTHVAISEKGPGESCGGMFDLAGTCAWGYACQPHPKYPQLPGICVKY
ncbi:hypothetical protein TNCV_1589051 [Trichonephila clavipes]|uniref:Uncharacterized protein n=1 Tax=Trichonephila clavipes TaxID=2585209 RepID=A0A8X6REV6_TRICX|nr:hypothetical protein TNCV_1589051 [Trichonephila clavipes]